MREPDELWRRVEKAVTAPDPAGVQALLSGLDDAGRRGLAGPLREYGRRWRRELRALERGPDWDHKAWDRHHALIPALLVAGAGCLTGAAAVARWLADWPSAAHGATGHDRVFPLLAERPPPAIPHSGRLGGRLGARAAPQDEEWQEGVVRLVVATGVEPPADRDFLSAWLGAAMRRCHLWGGPERRELSAVLAADPLLRPMLTALFSAERMGSFLEGAHLTPALVALTRTGAVSRDTLIGGCVGRLLRGGRLGELKGFTRLYQLLDVTVVEAAGYARDLVRTLPDAPSTVAGLAQRELRRIDEAGRLDVALLAEATEVTLYGDVKKLATAQLVWLDRALSRHPDGTGPLLAALAPAFGHPAADVRRRAVRLVARHAGRLDVAGREELASAAEALPAELRASVAEALGVPIAAPEPTPPPEPAAPPARRMPEPLGSFEELAEELAALLMASEAQLWGRGGLPLDPVAVERALAAVVAFAHADREALGEALRPVLPRHEITPGADRRPGSARRPRWFHAGPHWELRGVVAAAAGPVTGAPQDVGLSGRPTRLTRRTGISRAEWQTSADEFPAPSRVLLHRLREIADGLAQGPVPPVPALVATPSEATGLLDPAALLDRLALAARDGWRPWELDLQQALLRLPAEPAPDLAARAAALGTSAGDRLAERLRAGDREPAVARVDAAGSWLVPDAATPTDQGRDRLAAMLSRPPGRAEPQAMWAACWPATWPGHPDLIAACLAPLARPLVSGEGWPAVRITSSLAEAPGPVGPGMATALAYGLGAECAEDRAAVTDALVTLAARGRLDGGALGGRLGELTAGGDVKLTRAVPALREAAEAGAHRQVWEAVAAALPTLLPPAAERAPHRLADLVALGADVAETAGVGVPIPELTAYAARPGGSLLIRESRRLRDRLAAGL